MNVDVRNYISLYHQGVPLNQVKLPDPDDNYIIFRNSNVDIRIIDRDANLHLLVDRDKFGSLSNFLKDTSEYSHRYFYMVPIQTPKGTIVGFILRTVYGKSYMTIGNSFEDRMKQVPFMFGWFKDFLCYDREEKRLPIVVCEGPKDCMVLKKIYPYTLSNNTSSMGVNLEILRQISTDFVLVYDNDETGHTEMKKDKKILLNNGCFCDTTHVPDGYKDVSELVFDKVEFKKFGNSLLKKINDIHYHLC